LRKIKAKILKLKDYKECFRELKRLTPIYRPFFPSLKEIAFLKKLQEGNYLLHGDFYPSNIIIRKNKLFLIDFDKAGEGNFLIDLLAFYFWFELPKIKPLKMTLREIEECRDVFLKHYCKFSNFNLQRIKRDLKKFKVKIFLDCLHYVTFRAVRGWRKINEKLKNEFRNSIKTILEKINECI
jgi:Ser/Thr protein kinase RdoA (MazF antagonist)